MKALCLIQARLGSRRFPGKVLAGLGGRTVLAHVIERCQVIPGVDEVALTIPVGAADDALQWWADNLGIACHRGQRPLAGTEANDCLEAYRLAAHYFKVDWVLRVTADCPLLCPVIAGEVLDRLQTHRALFASNCRPTRTYPDGLDVEGFQVGLLDAAALSEDPYEREHVTPGMARLAWRLDCPWEAVHGSVQYEEDLSAIRWTLDIPEDLDRLRRIVAQLPDGTYDMASTIKAAHAAGVRP